jgi:hypothetical protein
VDGAEGSLIKARTEEPEKAAPDIEGQDHEGIKLPLFERDMDVIPNSRDKRFQITLKQRVRVARQDPALVRRPFALADQVTVADRCTFHPCGDVFARLIIVGCQVQFFDALQERQTLPH